MAADAMLAQGHDGRTLIGCAFGSGAAGEWQPLAGPTGAPLCDPSPWVGNAVPFLVKSASQFRTAGPLDLTSAEYAAEFNEVKEIGSLNSITRTAAQSHAAAFWQTNPAANYNAIARRFVDQLSLDVSDSARLLAMLDLSAADALITTWNDKYYRNFWRPITAIRHADIDGNPATVADPTWTPMFDPSLDPAIGGTGPALITPPYPEHPSGATTYASASMHALEVLLRHRRDDVLCDEQPVPGRTAHLRSLLRSDERGARSPHLGRDPFPECRRPGGEPRPRSRALHPQALLRSRALRLDAWSGLQAAPRASEPSHPYRWRRCGMRRIVGSNGAVGSPPGPSCPIHAPKVRNRGLGAMRVCPSNRPRAVYPWGFERIRGDRRKPPGMALQAGGRWFEPGTAHFGAADHAGMACSRGSAVPGRPRR
jgi:hypothetical protein